MSGTTHVSSKTDSWWASLRHGGLLIAPGRLAETFSVALPPLQRHLEDRLRSDVIRMQADPSHQAHLLDTVLAGLLGLGKPGMSGTGVWFKGNALDKGWSHRALSGEAIRPRRLWRGQHDAVFPVFVENLKDVPRIGIGRGRRSAARVIEWLRLAGLPLALLTNGKQWRLVHAGLDHDAFAEADIDLWFEDGRASDQVDALRILLSPASLQPTKEHESAPLLAAIAATRRGQSELSADLGERVRQAVELLVHEVLSKSSPPSEIDNRSLYIAATRTVMRLVVVLFAEAREDLLPRDNTVYYNSYSLEGLRLSLNSAGQGAGRDRLRNRYGAWPRILALFQLLHGGSHHERMPIPEYGGGLFEPGDSESEDGISRALALFEDPAHSPEDAVVLKLLSLITMAYAKVRQGKGTKDILAPVDFATLSSEYIGILYEGLLDFELHRVEDHDPVLFLKLGDQPALPLSRLEGMDDKQIAKLVEAFKKGNAKLSIQDDDDSDEESEEQEEDIEDPEEETEESVDPLEVTELLEEETQESDRDAARQRAEAWARRAVVAGKLVSKPRSKKADLLATHEMQVQSSARALIHRLLLPGQWYLVRYGGTRKGSGTFYTKPGLAVPTTRRTLLPLVSTPPLVDGKPNEDAASAEWTPKKPEEILALRVCDPACGSGSFLVASLRYLTDQLLRSLHHHKRIAAQGDRTLVTLAVGQPGDRLRDELLPCLPDAEDFEDRLRARLKRHVVERCIYGVDLDALAVELCRISLWIETLDRSLPFTFLDHKIKIGNSLVGCWLDQFAHYPVMAWERITGDKQHPTSVHHKAKTWENAIRDKRNGIVKHELVLAIQAEDRLFKDQIVLAESVHEKAQADLELLHELPIHDVEGRKLHYNQSFRNSEAVRALLDRFDAWCALWFWPPSEIASAPTALDLAKPSAASVGVSRRLAAQHKFFHWELEFPDVFVAGKACGFDAIIGNPPWEIQKPNSKEYFSNIDPLYRTYGKQEAEAHQKALFEKDASREEDWLAYCDRFKAYSNWVKNVSAAFGDPDHDANRKFSVASGKLGEGLHRRWRSIRNSSKSLADPKHPFLHQGSADLNTYKLFLELGHALLKRDGHMGFIVPSGIYTDKGTTDLRTLFLDQCRWRWLFGFENRDAIFDIHRSFKFCPIIVQKGGRTEAVRAAFMRRSLSDWESDQPSYISYPRDRVTQFSPKSKAILEISHRRDLEILEKIYSNSVLLGDDSDQGWGLKYAREFDMTNDSKLFPPRPKWEEKGYRPDEYSRWLLTTWHPRSPGSPAPANAPRHTIPAGIILSRSGDEWTSENEITDVALPLYEGRMIGQFDFSEKGWVSGKGRSAVWRDIPWDAKQVEPQYLMGQEDWNSRQTSGKSESSRISGLKLTFMAVGSATNRRSMFASLVRDVPCGNAVPVLQPTEGEAATLLMGAGMNSLAYDYSLRARLGGLNLNYFVLAETPLIQVKDQVEISRLIRMAAMMCLPHRWFSPTWAILSGNTLSRSVPPSRWPLTRHERQRLLCMTEAIVAVVYGLDCNEFSWIVQDCDHPRTALSDDVFCRKLSPKGFWRVDKGDDPELRHTVLALSALTELRAVIARVGGDLHKGVDEFCNQNNGEGWMLPEELCLADLGLGHDERAKVPQPVRSRFGERFLPFQLEQSAEDSWKECHLHARNLLGANEYGKLVAGSSVTASDESSVAAEGHDGLLKNVKWTKD